MYYTLKPSYQPHRDEYGLPLLLHAGNSPNEHNSSTCSGENASEYAPYNICKLENIEGFDEGYEYYYCTLVQTPDSE